jgi:outer membrane protein assembly factor BamD (BamD/ComL family)
MLFVVDAVLREWDARVSAEHLTGLAVFFYADNGHINGDDNSHVQEGLNIITELFQQMGLQMNLKKTKAMIHFGHSTSHHMSSSYCICPLL